jgi:carbonic anhydrase
MHDLIGRIVAFQKDDFPQRSALYERLASHGQNPKVLMISCADSRVVPEHIVRADPGDVFVCRNAGNIVPPFMENAGGVSSTVEYAVAALGVSEIIVCGHSDCGAMKGLAGDPERLSTMPTVAAWLRHAAAARQVVDSGYPELAAQDATGAERLRAVALENVVVQLAHLRTHPCVAAAIARGEMTLHGWFFDIAAGAVLALDGSTGRFGAIAEHRPLPVALAATPRRAAYYAEAAE